MTDKWYADFFSGVVVDMWRAAVPAEFTDCEVDTLVQWLKLTKGQHVLDLPCGFGRHSIRFAKRGFQVTGIDVSNEMIELARKEVAEADVSVDFQVGDMLRSNPLGQFDAAVCFGNSFGYLDRQGTRLFLSRVADSLPTGGCFAFDYGMAAESILPRFTEREWAPVNDLYFLESNRYRLLEGCIETTYTFIQEGRIETRTGLHWVYSVAEICNMLAEAGFEKIRLFSSLDEEPFQLGSPVMYLVCQKMSK